MVDKGAVERGKAVLKRNQEFALELGAQLMGEYDVKAYRHLMAQSRQVGSSIKDDTPENLKVKAKIPGAFFNKDMRPLHLGSD